jgi:hypothetical protein
MIRDYQIVSPSLEGVLNHDSVTYEGLKRPTELLRVLDGPAAKGDAGNAAKRGRSDSERKILEGYFHDLYGVFMKKLSHFVVEPDPASEDGVKLLALLQEMIKIKKLMVG